MKDFLYCIINLNSFKFGELSPLALLVGSMWVPKMIPGMLIWTLKRGHSKVLVVKDGTLSPANDGRLNLAKIFCRKNVTTSHCPSIGQQNPGRIVGAIKLPNLIALQRNRQ